MVGALCISRVAAPSGPLHGPLIFDSPPAAQLFVLKRQYAYTIEESIVQHVLSTVEDRGNIVLVVLAFSPGNVVCWNV